MFQDDTAGLDDVDYYYDHDDDDDSSNENLMPGSFRNVVELDVDYYYHDDGDDNGDEFVIRKFHGDAAGLDADDYDDEEFVGVNFHDVSKKNERVCDHCHYT